MFTNTIFIVFGGGCLTLFGRLEGKSSQQPQALIVITFVLRLRGLGFRMITQLTPNHIASIWWSWEMRVPLFVLNTLDFTLLGVLIK